MPIERTSYLEEISALEPIIQPPIEREMPEPEYEVQGVENRNLLTKASDLFLRDIPTGLLRGSEALLNAPFEMLGSALPGGDIEESKDNLWDIMAGKRGMSPNIERALFGWRRNMLLGWDPTSELPEDERGGFADEETPEWVGDMYKFTGETGGTVMALTKANQVAGSFMGMSSKLLKISGRPSAMAFSRTFPKASKYAPMLLQSALGFGLFGQAQKQTIMADWKTKAEELQKDMAVGAAFGGVAGIGFGATRSAVASKFTGIKQAVSNAIIEYPTMFGLGYTDTYFRNPDSTQEERIQNGLVLAFLHGVLNLADRPVRTGKMGEQFKDIPKDAVNEAIRRVPEMLEGKVVSEGQRLESRAVDELSAKIGKAKEEITFPEGVAETEIPIKDIGRVRRWIGSIYPMAEAIEAKTGLPFMSKWYRGIEKAHDSATRFRVWTNEKVDTFIPPKQQKNAKYMDSVGELGIALEKANVSPQSAKGQQIAEKMGLSQKELTMVADVQKFVTDNFFPIAKQLKPDLELKKNYWPLVRDYSRSESIGSAFGEFVPDDVYFGIRKRGVDDVNRIKNPVVLMNIYANSIAKKGYYQGPLDIYNQLKEHLPPRTRKRFDEFMNTNIGKVDRSPGIMYDALSNIDASLNKVLEKVADVEVLGKKIGKDLKVNTAENAVDLMNLINTSAYGMSIGGANLRPTGLQTVQALQLGVPEFGLKGVPYLIKGYKNAANPAVWERARKGGWIQTDLVSDGAIRAYDKYKSGIGRKAILTGTDAFRSMLWSIKAGDKLSRVVVGDAAWNQFNDAVQVYRNKGFEAFADKLGIAEGKNTLRKVFRLKFSDPLLREVKGLLEAENIHDAREAYIRYRLRNTNFSQLPGEFPGAGVGDFGGKSLYMLQTFPLHALNTARFRWSPSQIGTYIGMGAILTQAFRKVLGVDLKRSFGAQDLVAPLLEVRLVYANMLKTGLDWGAAALQGWDSKTDQTKDEFFKSLGIWSNQPKRVLLRLKKSLDNNYAILDGKGEIIEYGNALTTFMQLIGYTPNEVSIFYEESRLGSNEATRHQKKREELLELEQIIDDDKRNKKIDKWLEKNPDYLYLESDPAFLEQIWKTRREKLEEMNGIPQWLQPTLEEKREKVKKWF